MRRKMTERMLRRRRDPKEKTAGKTESGQEKDAQPRQGRGIRLSCVFPLRRKRRGIRPGEIKKYERLWNRMDATIQKNLELIKESVLQSVPAEAIYLFGSYAYGTPDNESDIDVYVVVPDDTTELPELQGDIRLLLKKNKLINFDLLIGRSSVFNRRKNGPTLERVIAQKGTMLYGI